MARRHILITAIAGTALLWGITIASAIHVDLLGDRLHLTLLAGSFLAAVTTVAMLGVLFLDLLLRRVAAELHDGVHQAADELHQAVGEMGEVLRLDRAAITATRALLAELRDVKLPRRSNSKDHGRVA